MAWFRDDMADVNSVPCCRVFDRRFFCLSVSACRYACDACTAHNINAPESEKKRATTFHAWDPGCLKRLPEYASKEFPFILTHHVGINTSYTGTPTNSLVSGGDFAAAANRVGEVGVDFFTGDAWDSL